MECVFCGIPVVKCFLRIMIAKKVAKAQGAFTHFVKHNPSLSRLTSTGFD